jgi:hypothetical protein
MVTSSDLLVITTSDLLLVSIAARLIELRAHVDFALFAACRCAGACNARRLAAAVEILNY